MDGFYLVLNRVIELYRSNEILWFRGHNDFSYKLNSGLYRGSHDKDEIIQCENDFYNAFVNYGDRFLHNFKDNKEWNTLFLMQHYGVDTRLLDWTSSFLVALYFANLNRQNGSGGAIWALNPKKLNQELKTIYNTEDIYSPGLITLESMPKRIQKYTSFFDRDLSMGSFALMPPQNNERLLLQQGFFTVQGTGGSPLEKEIETGLDQYLFKIDLPYDIFDFSNEFLRINNMNRFYLFGDMDNLSKFLKNDLFKICSK